MRDIILMHGALGTTADAAPLAAELRKLGFETHSLTFSGHGGEPFRQAFGLSQFATELREFILSQNLKAPLAFGFSMGGYVALALAVAEPKLLGKVVTLGTKFDWNEEVSARQIKALDLDQMQKNNPAQAAALEKAHGASWRELVKRTCDMLPRISAEAILNNDSLGKISTPCLIGLADQDRLVSLEETLEVYRNIKNAGMYMLPFSKHPLESVNHRLLARIIEDFAQAKP